MRIGNAVNSYFKVQHISKNYLKRTKSADNQLTIFKNRGFINRKRNIRLHRQSSVANTDTSSSDRGPLSRYLDNLKCHVNVWGSSLVELEVKLDGLKYLRSRSRFLRKFGSIELVSNGRRFAPNEVQLFSLRPQLTGSDLLINAPKGSGKTFLYLLPHLVYNYLFNNYDSFIKNSGLNLDNHKVAVLLPTIDMVLDDSRTANGCFKRYRKVASLLYKNLALNDLDHVVDSDLIYSTPKSFLKLLVRDSSVRSSVRFVVVDESERMIVGEFAYLLARIKSLLPVDSQFIFLSNFSHNHPLHQFASRFLKLNFKIISFTNRAEKRTKLIRHIYGPIRSIDKHVQIYNSINSNDPTGLDNDGVNASLIENTNKEHITQVDGPPEGDMVKRLESRIRLNRDAILNTKNRVALNDFKIEYVLYEPSRFLDALTNELDVNRKTLVYFPTVRMCQFCYIYIKHYLRRFSRANGLVDGDTFMFYDFHTGLSLEKRRYVLDSFKLAARGILFCTNLAIGINFHNVSKVIQVSFVFNVYELLNKFAHPVRNINGHSDRGHSVESVLLLNNLDGHILYEYYKNDVSVSYKSSFTASSAHDASLDLRRSNFDVYLLNSCELMYRSLLGFYSENAQRLKLDRWMIPSFLNEFLLSFGVTQPFSVSKHFALRTQLIDSPGLEVSRCSNRKSELISALKAYPGFISKSRQANITV
ncbi:uncharacterized protein TOT_030000593 [Theileria orientalis strain Shintoku]|uniref:ATP-dependent RNA helicase n=1 Tax=Theileria orientalis strain Shintoku TaxID=869250 RepID=J4D9E6_THEOR|nr:uncharacterized protein TOT_030000593 [Theileria orientalis strain Shintoku]BAM41330.1 uncharacterized protein TOT_030000593 [Theileria orientalis strain Shintoku]|eukprot:XP_009691631.1 uncharacterized protein TOT_030000593 [Theileria orientalis strain Shintoku]